MGCHEAGCNGHSRDATAIPRPYEHLDDWRAGPRLDIQDYGDSTMMYDSMPAEVSPDGNGLIRSGTVC